MNDNSRKRTSKWDLIGGQGNLEDNGRENARSGSYRAASNEYRSYSGRHSSAHAIESDPKYSTHSKDVRPKFESTVSVRDHASENRGTWRDNSLDRGNRGFSEAVTNWDEDGSRRDHGRSPRSSWKRPLRSTSRGRSRSRSRSQSPFCAYRHESGVNERPRSKPEVPTQTCRDFTFGRCRRGSYCPFRHPSTRNFEDRSYDFDHREESIQGGKYSHHNTADGDYNDYTRETLEPKREYDRNSKGTSFNHGAEREPRRSADIPCTFFVAGNCRNGKFCRFSHHIPSSSSSVGRAHDGRGKTNHSPEKSGQMNRGTKFSDSVDPRATEYVKEGRWRTNRSPDRVDQIYQGVKTNETADPHVEYGKEIYGPSESRSKVVSSSMIDGWGNNIEASYVTHGGPTTMDKVVEVEANKSSQWKTSNSGNITSTAELKGVDKWIGDKMSPEWNPKVSSARTVAKEEPACAIQTSESINHIVPSQASQLPQYVSSVMPDMVEKRKFQQRFNSINDAPGAFSYDRNVYGNVPTEFNSCLLSDNSAQPSTQNASYGAPGNLNAVGQGQFSVTSNHPGNENAGALRNSTANCDIYSIKSNCEDLKTSDAISGGTTASKIARQEQLAQLTDLSASLVHLLGKGQQLPHLYTAMNPLDPVSSVEISNGLVSPFPMETVHPYLPIAAGKSYEPVNENVGQIQLNISIAPSHHPPNPGMLRTSEDVRQDITVKEQNAGEVYKNGYAEGSHKPDTDSKPNKKPQVIPEESTEGKDNHAKSRDGSPLENVDGEGKVDRGKKVKDTKALRDFKHALVNCVKELLKPAWKDGRIDKEGFKTIVKKVVDKVTAAIQDANVPQTPEKVEQYLSASKPKLTKLVQAYVDRNQKKQT